MVEVELFREGDSLLLEPHTIIPLPVSRFTETGVKSPGGVAQPWSSDGKTWHLEKRCSRETRAMFLKLDDLIRDSHEVDGPRWDQKGYVAYRIGNYNWLAVVTRPKFLVLYFHVEAGVFKQSTLASELGVQEFEGDSSLSERLALPSSVQVKPRNEGADRVVLRVKEGFSLESGLPLFPGEGVHGPSPTAWHGGTSCGLNLDSLVRHFPKSPAQSQETLTFHAALQERVSFQIAFTTDDQPVQMTAVVEAPPRIERAAAKRRLCAHAAPQPVNAGCGVGTGWRSARLCARSALPLPHPSGRPARDECVLDHRTIPMDTAAGRVSGLLPTRIHG